MERLARFSLAVGLFSLVFSSDLHAQDSSDVRLARITARLAESRTGRSLLERARKLWGEDFLERGLVQFGRVSRTDAILSRQFDGETGQEMRKRETTVVLKDRQSDIHLLLDLSHELTHALSDPTWDPYDAQLTLSGYVVSIIEQSGGEIDALKNECQVALELSLKDIFQRSLFDDRCSRYMNPFTGRWDDRLLKQDFYRMGRHLNTMEREFPTAPTLFPALSSEAAEFISSTGGVPYPLALAREYVVISQRACTNTRERLKDLSTDLSADLSSEPVQAALQASVQAKKVMRNSIQEFLNKRCVYGFSQSVR